jgi:glycerophosphoryl diester phosphodiesterase
MAFLAPAAVVFLAAVSPRELDLEGHRGARGLAPENTLAAFARALSIGVTTLELDLGLTRDGVVVVGHDSRLSPDIVRGPEGGWLQSPTPSIFSLTFAELQTYDAGRLRPGSAYAARFPDQVPHDGERMPRLADVYALAERVGAMDVRFNVEIKTDPRTPQDTAVPEALTDAALEVVRAAGMEKRTTIQSFEWRSIRRVREKAPGLQTSCLTSEQPGDDTVQIGRPASPWLGGLDPAAHGNSVPRLVKAAGAEVWSPSYLDVTKERMAEAHALGLLVLVWTVNDPAEMVRQIELGVDGIISDRPDLLRAVMVARGMKVPAPAPVLP